MIRVAENLDFRSVRTEFGQVEEGKRLSRIVGPAKRQNLGVN